MPAQPTFRTKVHWGKRLAIVIGVFMVATLTFVAFALTKRVDLVRDDYYEASLSFDSRAQALRRAALLGDSVHIVATEAGNVEVVFLDPGQVTGTVTCYRPNEPGMDKSLPLAFESGRMVIGQDVLSPGAWHIRLTWSKAGAAYELERAVTL